MAAEKRLTERNGGELRELAKGRSQEIAASALAELERRRDNLRWAVVPEWEKELRGEDIREWVLA